jgi:hypothetical protein
MVALAGLVISYAPDSCALIDCGTIRMRMRAKEIEVIRVCALKNIYRVLLGVVSWLSRNSKADSKLQTGFSKNEIEPQVMAYHTYKPDPEFL